MKEQESAFVVRLVSLQSTLVTASARVTAIRAVAGVVDRLWKSIVERT